MAELRTIKDFSLVSLISSCSLSLDQNFAAQRKGTTAKKRKNRKRFLDHQCSSYKTFSRQILGALVTSGISRVSSKTSPLLPSARATNSVEQQTGQPNPKTGGILVLEPATTETIAVSPHKQRSFFLMNRSISSVWCRSSLLIRISTRRG